MSVNFGYFENIYNPIQSGNGMPDQYGGTQYNSWNAQGYGAGQEAQNYTGLTNDGYNYNTNHQNFTESISEPNSQWRFEATSTNTMTFSTDAIPLSQQAAMLGQTSYNPAATTGHPNFNQRFQIGKQQHFKQSTTRRKRKINKIQRVAANMRERRRMTHLNSAFEELKEVVPTLPHEKKLSRIQTLKLAMHYIEFMTRILHGSSYPPCPTIKLPEMETEDPAVDAEQYAYEEAWGDEQF